LARARGTSEPDNFCALNVALYGPSRRWSMTERGRESVQRDRHNFQAGPSAMRWRGDHLEIDIEEVTVPWPRRLRGRVRLYPAALSRFGAPLDDAGRHRWGPIAPCARVEVTFDAPAISWAGEAYLDSNEGDEPIDVPFVDWDWARAVLPDGGTGVIYDVRQKSGPDRVMALRFDRHGEATHVEAPPRQRLRPSAWGVRRTMRGDENAVHAVLQTLEDAPFYVRSVVRSSFLGQPVLAMHETLNAPRLASPLVKMLLPFRMPRRA
jgi:carotenoid 1,2-hydratase